MKRYAFLGNVLPAIVAGLLLFVLDRGWAGEPVSGEQLTIVVRETAGIRRFGYPVSTVLSMTGKPGENLRLLHKGKPIAAQFVPVSGRKSASGYEVDLDFNISLGPYETREYVVAGGGPPADSASRGGIAIKSIDDAWRVQHGTELEFVVPRNLLGLLQQVRTPKTEYLRAGSAGLLILGKDNSLLRVGAGAKVASLVNKPGPLVGSLHFRSTEAFGKGREVQSRVVMNFPVSKSWVEVRWTIDDPDVAVAGLGADLNLNIQGEPTLVDFGAGSLVYAHLRKGEAAKMQAGSLGAMRREKGWQTLTGPAGALTPYVVAPPFPQGRLAEGWAHIMDRERCTAVAVDGFDNQGQEADITVDANGRLQIWRRFVRVGEAPRSGWKNLTFWLHFVGMPVHVGAATSPQAMLAPLAVEVRRQQK
jgi:hypothetical protein